MLEALAAANSARVSQLAVSRILIHATSLFSTPALCLCCLCPCRTMPARVPSKQAVNYVASLRATDVSTGAVVHSPLTLAAGVTRLSS